MKHSVVYDVIRGGYRYVGVKLKSETSKEAEAIKNYLGYNIQPEQKEILDDYLLRIQYNGWGIKLADPKIDEGIFELIFEKVTGIGGL